MALIENGDTQNKFNEEAGSLSNKTKKGAKLGKKALEKKLGTSLEKIIIGAIKDFFIGLGSQFISLFVFIFLILSVTIFIAFLMTGDFNNNNNKIRPAFVDTALKGYIYNNFWDVAEMGIGRDNLRTRNPNIKYSGTKIADLIKPYIKDNNLFEFEDSLWGSIDQFVMLLFESPEPKDETDGLGYKLSANYDAYTTYNADINFEPSLEDMVLNGAAYATAIDNTAMYFSTPDEFNNQYTPDKSIQVNEDWSINKEAGKTDARLNKPIKDLTVTKNKEVTASLDIVDEKGNIIGTRETTEKINDFELTQETKDAIKNQTSNVAPENSDFYYFLNGTYPKITKIKHWNGENDNFYSRVVDEVGGIRNAFVLIDPTGDTPYLEELYGSVYPKDKTWDWYAQGEMSTFYMLTPKAAELQEKYVQWKNKGINWDFIEEKTEEVTQQNSKFLELDDDIKNRYIRTKPVFEISSDTSEWSHGDTEHKTWTQTETKHHQEWYNKQTNETADLKFNYDVNGRDHTYENGKEVNLGNYGLRDSDETYEVTYTYNDYSLDVEIPYDFDFTEYKEKLLEQKAEELVGKGKCIPDTPYGESSNTCTLEEATEWVDTVKDQYLVAAMSSLGVEDEYYGQFYGLADNGFNGIVDYSLSSFNYDAYSGEYKNTGKSNKSSAYYKYFVHCNTLQSEGKIHGSAAVWGPGSCTYVAQAWFYDIYGMNSSGSGASGTGKQFVDNVLKAHPDKFVESSTPAPGAILSIYSSGAGHVLCIDAFDGEWITVTEGSYTNDGDLRIRCRMKYSDFLNQKYIKGKKLKYAVPIAN